MIDIDPKSASPKGLPPLVEIRDEAPLTLRIVKTDKGAVVLHYYFPTKVVVRSQILISRGRSKFWREVPLATAKVMDAIDSANLKKTGRTDAE